MAYGFHWIREDRSIKFADEEAVRSSCGSAVAHIAPGRYKSIASRVVSRVCPTSLQTWRSFAAGPSGIMMNRLWHIAYKVGFCMARLWWWLRHPDHDDAIVAIWFEGHVLVVRQSYRTNLTFPGGGIRRGEGPRDAARREVAEEIGLAVTRDDLRLVDDAVSEWDFRRDRVRIFEPHLHAAPHVKIDGREIVDARFVDPKDCSRRRAFRRSFAITCSGFAPWRSSCRWVMAWLTDRAFTACGFPVPNTRQPQVAMSSNMPSGLGWS